MHSKIATKTIDELVSAARAASKRAYAPYSSFQVGAALLDEYGRIHLGCNVENAAYPLTQCAEANAIGALIMSGAKRIIAAAVAGVAADPITPCGGCRQKLREFMSPSDLIVSADMDHVLAYFTMGELLPRSFGPAHLGHAEVVSQSRG